ncbi:winged helix-turn-helix domain-containing protein [Actinomadura barringtoniae]|uniref:Winged helix-turn-helix domain-containing protein n=1 Tax=Actinomadura barringtoniae TaxID=1427535 RepID=A0A939PSG8_9ACTN|nr:BTAD domain-containing putative transcriptional regulator [Actinomadura barringtoniae]MBO2455433.1 winged helix-turn-helix domain-containing protein [Actinomadura barringtoniae]
MLGDATGTQVAQAPLPGLHAAASVAEALNFIGGEVVGRTATMQDSDDDGSPGPDEGAALVPLVCVLDPVEQATRTEYELRRGASLAIGGLLLSDWPHGTTLAVDSSGVIMDATGKAAETMTGTQATLLAEADARKQLVALGLVGDARLAANRGPGTAPMATVRATGGHAPSVLIRLIGGQYVIEGRSGTISLPPDHRALLAVLAEYRGRLIDKATIENKVWGPGGSPKVNRFDVVMKETRTKLCEAMGLATNQGTRLIENPRHAGYRVNAELIGYDVWQLRDLLGRARTAHADDKYTALAEAVEKYTGPYLADFQQDWARPEARGLARGVFGALVQLAGLETDLERAALRLDHAAELDPVDSLVCRRRMQTYAELGRIADVRICYQQFTEHLKQRGTKVDAQTTALYRELVDMAEA